MPMVATGHAARGKRSRYITFDVELGGPPPNLSRTGTSASLRRTGLGEQARPREMIEKVIGGPEEAGGGLGDEGAGGTR